MAAPCPLGISLRKRGLFGHIIIFYWPSLFGQDGWIFRLVFLALLWTDGDGQHLAILIEQAWSITHIMGIVFDIALKCTLFECQCIWDTIFTSPTGDHPSHGRTSRLQCKGSTFISQLF